MIDYMKVHVVDTTPEILLNNPLLDFYYEMNPDTGEVRTLGRSGKKQIPHRKAYYRNLVFRIYDNGTIIIEGSIHVYWNDGQHNFNDFNITAINAVLEDIREKFKITSSQMILRQVEIGVNITPPYSTYDILKYCFQHKKSPFEWKKVPDEGRYIQADHSQYFIKIYDKARHYKKKGFNVGKNEILRFEKKYIKLESLKKRNISTVNDLVKGLKGFVDVLTKEWEHVLFYDFTISLESELLYKFRDRFYWDAIKNKRVYYKQRSKLAEIARTNSTNIALQIERLITQKALDLMKGGVVIDQDNILSEGVVIDRSNRISKSVVIDQEINSSGGVVYDSLYIESINTSNKNDKKRLCPVTGYDISMQKSTSKYLSNVGLKYLRDNKPDDYEKLKRLFLSRKSYSGSLPRFENDEVSCLAKQIRNTAQNPKRFTPKVTIEQTAFNW